MKATYKAILRDNHLEWSDEAPQLPPGQPIAVDVTIVQEVQQRTMQGQDMAAALDQLADNNTLDHISDPVSWEREVRKERQLPYRET